MSVYCNVTSTRRSHVSATHAWRDQWLSTSAFGGRPIKSYIGTRSAEAMDTSHRSDWPLWVMLWGFENNKMEYPEPTAELCGGLMQIWLAIGQDDARCQQFQHTLFNAQLNTDRLLREWMWWLVITKVDVLSDFGVSVLSKHWDQRAYGDGKQPPQLVHSDDSQKYSKSLSHLLWCEFAPVKADAVTRTKMLQLARKECAINAACMRVAREALLFPTPITNAAISEDLGPPELSTRWPTSASALINACPWLEFETSSYARPHFLWDVRQRRTVVVADVSPQAEYIAISHTWGRWKKRGADGGAIDTTLPGALWPVPANDSFDVSALPDMLDALRNQTAYVWLDLVCIPQDRSPLAISEIARQGAIFRNAQQCICWLRNVEQWTGMRDAVEWLCRQYILQHDDGTWPGDGAPAPQQHANRCELVRAGEDFYRNGEWYFDDVDPWFTSLWTLQEVCIRADMILCNRRFEPLAVGPAGFPVAIADISALLYQVSRADEADQGPPVVRQVANLWAATGLHQIFKLSRAMIIHLGDSRQCSGRYPEARAEAVMSAMGVVDWFLPYREKSAREKQESLVLAVYPLHFLKELREKAGSASFFSDSTMDFEAILKTFYFDNWSEHVRVVGSLLPFGPGKITNTSDMSIFDTDESHTGSWTLNANGTVNIKSAFLQSSSEHDTSVPFDCTWFGPDVDAHDYRPRFYRDPGNLTDYLKRFKPERRNYAVAVTSGPLIVQGIILKEVAAGVLIKIGDYTCRTRSRDGQLVGKDVNVDWTVL